MDETNEQALLLEALSDKVLHQLPAAVWKGLFLGAGRDSIHFEHRHLTLVHADAVLTAGGSLQGWEQFCAELPRLAARHGGRVDPYGSAAARVTFEEPAAAVRMAMALQRAAGGLPLRVGVVSGPCTLAFFRVEGRLWCTPLGEQPRRAAQVAATAPLCGLVISPETYAPAAPSQARTDSPDFQDSEVDFSTLAGAAARAGATAAAAWEPGR